MKPAKSLRGWARMSLCVPLLVACGGKTESGGVNAVGGASAGSAPIVDVGGSTVAGAPAAGAASSAPDPSNFAGRWALIMSEELTGVQLMQAQGVLSGTGCGGGAPPHVEPTLGDRLCGPVSGSVSGNTAQFAYQFEFGNYLMNVTLAADRSRMTGSMIDLGTPEEPPSNSFSMYPTAWLPLSDGETWLPGNLGTTEQQLYDLELQSADAGATEYVLGPPYTLNYVPDSQHGGINCDLGTFSDSELSGASSEDAEGTVQAGPVVFTEPQLAVSLSLQKQNHLFTQVSAVTGSGHHYTFSASLVRQAP